METVITIRLPEELKEEMDKYKINWSEEVRKEISKKVRILRMLDILEEMEKDAKNMKVVGDSTALIREDRDSR